MGSQPIWRLGGLWSASHYLHENCVASADLAEEAKKRKRADERLAAQEEKLLRKAKRYKGG